MTFPGLVLATSLLNSQSISSVTEKAIGRMSIDTMQVQGTIL